MRSPGWSGVAARAHPPRESGRRRTHRTDAARCNRTGSSACSAGRARRSARAACRTGGSWSTRARSSMRRTGQSTAEESVRRLLLRNVIARPRVLAAAMLPARILAGSGTAAAGCPHRHHAFARAAANAERQLPQRIGAPFRPGDELAAPAEPRAKRSCSPAASWANCSATCTARPGGCSPATAVQPSAPAGRAVAVRSTHTTATSISRGSWREGTSMRWRRRRTPIVVNSAGCGAAMKEYGDLLAGDPRTRSERGRSRRA